MKNILNSNIYFQDLKLMSNPYGFTLLELRGLMELRGDEARQKGLTPGCITNYITKFFYYLNYNLF